MSKLSCGPGNCHVLSSNGPPLHVMDFYSTTYSRAHGKETVRSLRTLRHKGTGYEANFRPAVRYSKQLDEADNPAVCNLLKDNYCTVMKGSYTSHQVADGGERIENAVLPGGSGFSTNGSLTTATHRSMSADYSRELKGACRAEPNSITMCRKLSTEYTYNYVRKPFVHEGTVNLGAHAAKKESGFTHTSGMSNVVLSPGCASWGQVSCTAHCLSSSYPQGLTKEAGQELPNVCASQSGTGFVKGQAHDSIVQPKASEKVGYTTLRLHPVALDRLRKLDPAEYSITIAPEKHLSLTRYSQAQATRTPEGTLLNRVFVGRSSALTGFTENNSNAAAGGSDTSAGPLPVSTYRLAHGGDACRQNRTVADVRSAAPDGFTKSTRVHAFGPKVDTAAVLRCQDPYVARSMMKRDPTFDDHTYDKKLRC